MQVDPIKPTLDALGTWRLKLKRDELLSCSAFKSIVRRCTMIHTMQLPSLEEHGANMVGHSITGRALHMLTR